jgi:hypothetical protein
VFDDEPDVALDVAGAEELPPAPDVVPDEVPLEHAVIASATADKTAMAPACRRFPAAHFPAALCIKKPSHP